MTATLSSRINHSLAPRVDCAIRQSCPVLSHDSYLVFVDGVPWRTNLVAPKAVSGKFEQFQEHIASRQYGEEPAVVGQRSAEPEEPVKIVECLGLSATVS